MRGSAEDRNMGGERGELPSSPSARAQVAWDYSWVTPCLYSQLQIYLCLGSRNLPSSWPFGPGMCQWEPVAVNPRRLPHTEPSFYLEIAYGYRSLSNQRESDKLHSEPGLLGRRLLFSHLLPQAGPGYFILGKATRWSGGPGRRVRGPQGHREPLGLEALSLIILQSEHT